MTDGMDSILDQVRGAIARHAMFSDNARILVAISGGPDSVCLLHVLRELGYAVEAAHFDHQTRRGESRADADFVRGLARDLGVTCHTETRPIEREAEDSPLSFEEYARQARYEFLERTAINTSCVAIATGHHREDNAETVLMRVIKGTAPRGLSGIPAVREGGSVPVARPLIQCTRSQIMAFLHRRKIAYRTDTSNQDTRFYRNRIRMELMPLLQRDYNPRVREALCRLSEVHREEDAYLRIRASSFLDTCLDEDGRINRDRFAAGHKALQRRALLTLAWRHGAEPDYELVEKAVDLLTTGATGTACDLSGGVLLRVGKSLAEIETHAEPSDTVPVDLMLPGETCAFGQIFTTRFLESPPDEPLDLYCHPRRQVFDADTAAEPLTLRKRLPGDRFTPLGMEGSRRVKEYFIGLGLTRGQRDNQVLLTGPWGIVWVVGYAIAAHAAVTERTQRWLEVEVRDAPL